MPTTDLVVKPENLIRTLMKTEQSPVHFIPDDIDNDLLKQYAKTASRAYEDAKLAVCRLRPFMGRILLMYKRRPELFKDLNFKNFDDWMTKGVLTHYQIPRGDAYDLVRIAEECSDLPAETLIQLGMNKLKTVSNIVRQVNKGVTTVEMKKNNLDKWVALAQDHTDEQLKALAEAAHAVDEGSLEPKVSIVIMVTPQRKEQWENFKADEAIKAYVTQTAGMVSDDVLLECILSECETEWKSQMLDAMRQNAPVTIEA